MTLTITFTLCALLVFNVNFAVDGTSLHIINDNTQLIVLRIIFKRYAEDEIFTKLTESCKIQEKATDADIKAWKDNVTPQTRIMKCMNACGLEKLGLVTNKMLNVDTVMKMVEMDVKNNTKIIDYQTVVDSCRLITDSDRCEASSKIIDCVNSAASNFGMRKLL